MIHSPHRHLPRPNPRVSNGIILRMQKHLLSFALPHTSLHASNNPLHIHPHARRPAHEDAGAVAEFALQALEHVRYVRAAVLGAPGGLLGVEGRHEGEAHEVLLQHGGRRGETEVEVGFVFLGRGGVLGGDGEGGFAAGVGFLRWGEEGRVWEAGDGVFVLGAHFSLLLGIATRCFCDEG